MVWTFKFVLQIFSVIQKVLQFLLTKCFFFPAVTEEVSVTLQPSLHQIYTSRKLLVVGELEADVWKHCASINALIWQ